MLMISMDLPDMAICTSPGFCALPQGMFSDAQTMTDDLGLGLSSAMARIAPIIGSTAGHVVLHLFHAVGGLDGDAAGVEGYALADQPEHGLSVFGAWAHSSSRSSRAVLRRSPVRRSRRRPSSAP